MVNFAADAAARMDIPAALCTLLSVGVALKLIRATTMKIPSGIYVPPIRSRSLLTLIVGHVYDRRGPAYLWHQRMMEKIPKYTPFLHWLFHLPRVVITNPADIEHVLNSGSFNWSKAPTYRAIAAIAGDSILTQLDDDVHWAMRKEMGSAFSPQALKRIANSTVKHHMKVFIEQLSRVAQKGQGQNTTLFQNMVVKITLDVIAECAFHAEKESIDRVASAFTDLQGCMSPWLLLSIARQLPTAKARTLRRSRRSIEDVISDSIRQAIARGQPPEGEGKSLLDYLVFSKNLSPKDVSENALTFMFAGHETTATALTWMIYLMCKHADVQEKLYEELCSVLGKGATCEVDDLRNCRYLHCVIRESLRIRPAVSQISRMARSDDVLPGSKTFVPKGINVECSIFFLHRDPATWGADAEEFKPERWEDPALEGKLTEVSWMPFSIGRRNCIGKDFAMNELVLLLAALVRNFKWVWPADEPDVEPSFAIVYRPKKRYRVAVSERE